MLLAQLHHCCYLRASVRALNTPNRLASTVASRQDIGAPPMDRQASTEVSISGNQPGPSLAPFLIGVAGGTASGKTSVCRKIMKQLRKDVPVSRTAAF